jgi:hypothetical protein
MLPRVWTSERALRDVLRDRASGWKLIAAMKREKSPPA